MGGEEFSAFLFFFRSLLVQEFVFSGEPLCTNFFFSQILLFLNSEILIHYLCFCAL